MSTEHTDVPARRWVAINLAMNVALWGVGLSYYLKGDGMRFTNAAVMIGCLLVCAVAWLMLLYRKGKTIFTGRPVALLLLLVNIVFALYVAWELPGLKDVGPPG